MKFIVQTFKNKMKFIFSILFKFKKNKKYIVSLFNQLASGIQTAGYTLYLASTLSRSDYGYFGLFVVTVGLALSISEAGIGTQLSVGYFENESDLTKRKYVSAFFTLTLVLNLIPMIGAGILFLILAPDKIIAGINVFHLISLLLFCSLFGSVKSIYSRLFFLTGNEVAALKSNVINGIVLVSVCYLNGAEDLKKCLENLILSNLASCLYSFKITNVPFGINKKYVIGIFNGIKNNAVWAVFGVIIIWIQNQSYTYISSTTLGIDAVAVANVAKNFLLPITFFSPALAQIFLPKMLRESSIKQVENLALTYSAVLITITLPYCFLLISYIYLFGNFALINKYSANELLPIIIAWSLVAIAQATRGGVTLTYQVEKRFKEISLITCCSAFFSVLSSVVLLKWLGVMGSVLGVLLGEMILGIFLWTRLKLRMGNVL